MKKYELIDHTADVGLKAYGQSLEEAFSHIAQGMFDLITDHSPVQSVGEYSISLEAPDLEQLLVDWLSELLFLHSAKNLVFGDFKVTIKNTSLTAHIYGEEFQIPKHQIGMEIKAVTYHLVEVHNKSPYFVQILFDI